MKSFRRLCALCCAFFVALTGTAQDVPSETVTLTFAEKGSADANGDTTAITLKTAVTAGLTLAGSGGSKAIADVAAAVAEGGLALTGKGQNGTASAAVTRLQANSPTYSATDVSGTAIEKAAIFTPDCQLYRDGGTASALGADEQYWQADFPVALADGQAFSVAGITIDAFLMNQSGGTNNTGAANKRTDYTLTVMQGGEALGRLQGTVPQITTATQATAVTLAAETPIDVRGPFVLRVRGRQNASDGVNKFYMGLSSVVLTGSSPGAVTLWTREQTAADNNAGVSAFYARMDSDLLSGDAADALPEEVGLRQVTVTWRNTSQAATNPDRVRYLTVTDGTDEIARSRALTSAPTYGSGSTFVFDSVTLAKGTLYTFAFRDEYGEPLTNVGIRLKGEETAQSGGLYAAGYAAYMPVVSFLLGEALPDASQTLTQAEASDNGNYAGFCARLDSPLLTRSPEGLTLPVPTQVQKLSVRWREGTGGNAAAVRYAVIRDAGGAEVARSTKLAAAPANGSVSTFVFREALLDPAAVYTYAFLNDGGGAVTDAGLRLGRNNEDNETSGLYAVGDTAWSPVVTFTVAEPDFAAMAEADHRYAFDGDTLEDTGRAASKADLTAENNPAYRDVSAATGVGGDRALTQGTPWGGLSLPEGAWTVTAALKTGSVPTGTVLWAFGSKTESKLTVSAGSRPDEIVLSTATADVAVTPLVSVQVPGIGERFSLLGIGRNGSVLTVTVNGRPVATAEWPLTGALTNFQIGGIFGDVGNSGLTKLSGTTGYELADFRVFNRTLSAEAFDAVCAGAFRLLRRREAATAAEAVRSDAGALWRSPDGLDAAYPTDAGLAGTLTAEAVVTGTATLESVLEAVQGAALTAAQLTVHGAALTYAPTDLEGLTGYALPASAPLWLSGSLTVTLGETLMKDFVTSWLSDPSTAIPLGPAPIYAAVSMPGLPAGFFPKLTETAEGAALTLESGSGPARFGRLSMRIGIDTLDAGVAYGLEGWTVPGGQWATAAFAGGVGISQTVTMAPGTLIDSVTGNAEPRVGLTLTLGGQWHSDGIADKLMYGYCEGSTRMVWSGLEPGVPYDVAIYFAATGTLRSPVRVKGETDVYWTYANGSLSSFETAESVIPADKAWGSNKTDGWEAGTNAAVLTGLLPAADGTLTLEVYSDASPDLGWSVEGVSNNHLCGVQIRPNADAPAPAVYTRTLTGGTEPWVSAGAWTNSADGTAADEPPAGATLMVTLTADSELTLGKAAEFGMMTLFGGHTLTLRPDETFLSEADLGVLFGSTSLSKPLVSGVFDADNVRFAADGLSLVRQAVGISGTAVRLDYLSSAAYRLVSASFMYEDSATYRLADDAEEGLYPEAGAFWNQFVDDASSEPQPLSVTGGAGTVPTLTWRAYARYFATAMASVIQRGRLDDFNTSANQRVQLAFDDLDDFARTGYTLVLYAANDEANRSYMPYTVTAEDGEARDYTMGADGLLAVPGSAVWGSTNETAMTVGRNVMVIPNLKATALSVSTYRNDNAGGGRGVFAAAQIAAGYETVRLATLDGTSVDWADIAWRDAAGAGASAPGADTAAVLTLTADTTVTVNEPIAVGCLAVRGPGRLTLKPGAGVINVSDLYVNGSAAFVLVDGRVEAGSVGVDLSGVFGADGEVDDSGNGISVSVTLPPTKPLLSVNFTNSGSQVLAADSAEGLWPVPGNLWYQFGEASGTNVLDGVTFSWKGTVWDGQWNATSMEAVIQKGRLDDGSSSESNPLWVQFEGLDALTDGKPYTVAVYSASDYAYDAFAPFKVALDGADQGFYTASADDGVAAPGNSWWGRADVYPITPGANVMLLRDLTADTLKLSTWFSAGTSTGRYRSRGTVAALQIAVAERYDAVWTAEASGEAQAVGLTWVGADGQIGTPGANDALLLTLTGDTVLDVSGLQGGLIAVSGNGHSLTVTNHGGLSLPWRFSSDTRYVLRSDADALPTTVVAYPGTVVYTYDYTGAFEAGVFPVAEFAAGFHGTLTRTGAAEIRFTGGTVTLPHLGNGSGEGRGRLKVVLSGDVSVTGGIGSDGGTDYRMVRLAGVDLEMRDRAYLETDVLRLGENTAAEGGAATLTMEADSVIRVMDSRTLDSNQNPIILAHWNADTAVTLRGNAQLLAENTYIQLCRDGRCTLSIGNNALVKTLGVRRYTGNPQRGIVELSGNGCLEVASSYQLGTTESGAPELHLLGPQADDPADAVSVLAFSDSGSLARVPRFGANPAQPLCLAAAAGATFTVGNFGEWPLSPAAGAAVSYPVIAGEGTVVLQARSLDTLALAGGELALTGGDMTVGILRVGPGSRIRRIVSENVSEGGYIRMPELPSESDIANLSFALWLDPDRGSASRLLPRYPLIVGGGMTASGDSLTPVPGSAFSVINNTNNAISSALLQKGTADGMTGYFAVLKGAEVVRTREIAVGAEGYGLSQGALSDYSQIRFTGSVADAEITVPSGGIALNYGAFAGSNALVLKASGSEPYTLLRGKSYVVTAPLTVDVTGWRDALLMQARGAVRGLPAAVCLISGGIDAVEGLITARTGIAEGDLPVGVTASLEKTDQGLYYVFTAAGRLARSVPVAFTEAGTAVTSPATPGAWPVPYVSWNVLTGSWTTDTLTLADAAGGAAGQAMRTEASADGTATVTLPTSVYTYMKDVGANDAAGTALFRRWAETGAKTQTVTVHNVPFAAYRVAVTLAAEAAEEGFAPVTVNGTALTMDADAPYVRTAGDTAWGDASETSGTVLSANTLISGVFDDPTATVTLEPTMPGIRGSGLAAIQIVEAPESAAAAAAQAFAYTFAQDGGYMLADLNLTVAGGTQAQWVSGPENTLTLDCGGHNVILTLPAAFMAGRVTASNGSLTLRMSGGSRTAAIGTLDCGGLTDVTVDIDVLGTVFAAPTGTATFNALFDNAGQSYTIAAGQTLALGADSGITTNMDSALTGTGTGLLTVDAAGSSGTLRRDYPVTNAAADVRNLTVAYGSGTLATDGTSNWYTPLRLDEGDEVYRSDGSLWFVGSDNDVAYTQTGGTLRFSNPLATGNNVGFLAGPNTSQRANITADISGGRLETAALLAWHGSFTVNLTGGTVALGNKLHAQETGRPFVMNVSEEGTLEVLGQTLAKGGEGPVTVTFAGGRITVAQATGTITAPLVFAAEEATPTRIAPPAGAALVLNAANSGSGCLRVESGTLAAANAAALGSATVTVAPGAAFEGRVAGGIDSGTLKLQAGATLSVSGFDGAATAQSYRFAGGIVLEDGVTAEDITFMRGGVRCSGTVDGDTGTVTFGEAADGRSLTWAVTDGTWAVGEDSPWSSAQAFRNGDSVTFPAVDGATAEDPAEVTVFGNVMPAAFTVTSEDAAHNTYRFAGADANARVTVPGAETVSLPPQVYDVPVIAPDATAFALGAGEAGSTVRLFGTSLANGTATFAGVYTPETGSPAIVLTPHAGETQNLSAAAANLRGGATLVVRGQTASDGSVSGGTVNLSAGASNATTPANGVFAGRLVVEDGARLTLSNTNAVDGLLFGSEFWTVSGTAEDAPITVRNGGTAEFLSRQIWMGWQNGFPQERLESVLVRLDAGGVLVDSSTGNDWFGHTLIFAGEGALAEIRGDTFRWTRGAGFRAVRLAEPESGEGTSEGQAAVPYTATVRGTHANGLILDDNYSTMPTRPVAVEEGATLRLESNLTGTTAYPIEKTGAGRLLLEYPTVTGGFALNVREGSLGGSARLSNAASSVAVSSGACIEAGLDLFSLTLNDGAALAVDPSGNRVLRADTVAFLTPVTVTVGVLPDATVPPAAGRAPVRVMSWNANTGAAMAGFALSEALSDAGYALEVRGDGLYLMPREVWTRTLSLAGVTPGTGGYVLSWFAKDAWQGPGSDGSAGTLTDYAPSADAAAEVVFVLKDAVTVPSLKITLDRGVRAATVRFETESGAMVTPTVTYVYDLSSVKPAGGSSETVTWMPTLKVGTASSPAAVSAANVASGYAASVASNAVTVYPAGGNADALNINFGATVAGAVQTVDSSVSAAGAVPFDGIYWTNASVQADQRIYAEGTRRVYGLTARILGRSADADDPNANAVGVRYLVTGDPAAVTARRTYANSRLTAGFLRGDKTADVSAVLTAAGMPVPTADGGRSIGWMVELGNIPYRFYDLYLIFASEGEGEVTYPAVQIRVGDGAWRVYAYCNGFAAPSGTAGWAGTAAPALGRLEDGRSYLRLRFDAGDADSLAVAPYDSALENPAAVGLAALQIVPCTDSLGNADGAWLTRPAGGTWTTGTWTLYTADESEQGRQVSWSDATAEQPYGAVIGGSMTVNESIRAAWVRPTASLTVGSEAGAVATASALDLAELPEQSTVTLEEYPFDDGLSVIFGRNVTLSLTSEQSEKTLDWLWDTASVANAGPSVLKVALPEGGRLTLTEPVYTALDIVSGELCLDSDGTYYRGQAVTGTSGTFVKRGSGTVQIGNGTFSPGGTTPIVVEEGTLEIQAALGGSLGTGKTLVASGSGELWLTPPDQNGNALPAGTTLRAENGGTVSASRANPFSTVVANRPDVVLDGGTWASRFRNGGDHIKIKGMTLSGISAVRFRNQGADYAYNREGLVVSGSLSFRAGTFTLDGDSGNLRGNGIVVEANAISLAAGASVTSALPIRASANGGTLTLRGPGTWKQNTSININNNDFKATALTLTDGVDFVYALGGGNHNIFSDSEETRSTITVEDGATFSGNVTLGKKSPLLIKGAAEDAEPGILRGGVPGVANSSVRINGGSSLTLEAGTVLEYDLNKTSPAVVFDATSTATWGGNVRVRLTNYSGKTVTADGTCLIQWPEGSAAAPTQSTVDTWKCPEAVALSARLEVRADGLYLVSDADSAAVWGGATGTWFTPGAWQDGTLPADGGSARLTAASAGVTVTLDGEDELENVVFDVASGRDLTLDTPADNPRTLRVVGELWKVGAGPATVSAPVAFTAAAGGVTVAGGTLTVRTPLRYVSGTQTSASVSGTVTLESGTVLAFDGLPKDNATQTLAGGLSGTGTLRIAGAAATDTAAAVRTAVTVERAEQGSAVYEVAHDADLTLKASAGARTAVNAAARTLTVAPGGTLTADGAMALGGSAAWTMTLTGSRADGAETPATLALANDSIYAGTLKAVGPATVGGSGALAGDTVFETADAADTLTFNGTMRAYSGAIEGAVTKTGAGTLVLISGYGVNFPMTVTGGAVVLPDAAAFGIADSNNGATVADWTFESGTVLRAAASQLDLAGGTLTLRAGSALDLSNGFTAVGRVVFESGSTLVLRPLADGTPASLTYAALEASGTVTVDLDLLDVEALTADSYTLVGDSGSGTRSGGRCFVLGGSRIADFVNAGWVLRDNGTTVTFVRHGSGAKELTYTGTAAPASGAYRWSDANWLGLDYDPGQGESPIQAWPNVAAEGGTYGARFGETYADPTDGSEKTVPVEARTVDWGSLGSQNLYALTVDNVPGGDYTLSASGSSATPTLAGDVLKTGDGNLTVEWPLAFASNTEAYGLTLLGGTTVLKQDFGSAFTGTVTMMGADTVLELAAATGSVSLSGTFMGDGQAVLRKTGANTLSLGLLTEGKLKALDLQAGTTELTSAAATAPVTLGGKATLAVRPGSVLPDAAAVTLDVNREAAAAGTFAWRGMASVVAGRTPTLAGTLNVAAFDYQPVSGHLLMPAGNAVLPETASWKIGGVSTSSALWLEGPTAAGGLSGSGEIGVNPSVHAGDAGGERTLTLKLAESATFGGILRGSASDGTEIRPALALEKAVGAAGTPRLTLTGVTAAAYLPGTLTVGNSTEAMVNGTWAGDAAVSAGGTLLGRGILTSTGRTLSVDKAGVLCAASEETYADRDGNSVTGLRAAELGVSGTLALRSGSVMQVLLQTDWTNGQVPLVSCVSAESLSLPPTDEDGSAEIKLDIVLDVEEGAVVTSAPILRWTTLNGALAVNGRVYDSWEKYRAAQALRAAGKYEEAKACESKAYLLRQENGALWLRSAGNRFWIFLR